jgi:iron(III) transport system ATP-binding protein
MITYDGIQVAFGDHLAIPDLNLTIEEGEFFTLLGPSGCGKTTALRTLAGFIQPTAGELIIDGKTVTRLPSEQRRVGMVFQNYALFPSMSVRENIAFGLQVRKTKRPETTKLVDEIAEQVELTPEQLEKNVAELSGSSSASPSRGHSSSSRASCCWTSRSRTSTRSCACSCASS